MKRLLIATSNPAKLDEYRLLLESSDIDCVSLADAGIREHPEETGSTFAENALLKARFYFGRAAIATLADDGGLEIDALGGEPGVHSHRWLGGGAENSDASLVAEVMRRMRGVPDGRRTARIASALALTFRTGTGELRELVEQDSLEGVIAPVPLPRIRPGFPYRSVLWLPERRCYLGELGDREEARLSQRRKALLRLAPELRHIAV
ncbi:MAG TPA: non-canonical purine NTP pyrophosphatase [Candidatus Binataceae bacterium]|nr:non-canonical purine NTP pyrophosphatase [Candidatus Binataceae bacterium]